MSIASIGEISDALARVTSTELIVIGSSVGGVGSSLIIDVLNILEDLRPEVHIHVVVVNSPVVSTSSIQPYANAVATMQELRQFIAATWGNSTQSRQGLRTIRILNEPHPEAIVNLTEHVNEIALATRAESACHEFAMLMNPVLDRLKLKKIQFASEEFQKAFRPATTHAFGGLISKEASIDYLPLLLRQIPTFDRDPLTMAFTFLRTALMSDGVKELDQAREQTIKIFLDRTRTHGVGQRDLWNSWLYCRSRILTEFVDYELLKACTRGWITALCMNRIHNRNGLVSIVAKDGSAHTFLTLRPVHESGVNALPCVIEAAPIANCANANFINQGKLAIDALVSYSSQELLAAFPNASPVVSAESRWRQENLELLGLGAPLLDDNVSTADPSTDALQEKLLQQRELALMLVQRPYVGNESVDESGSIEPPEIFFMDIVDVYLEEVDRLLRGEQSPDEEVLYARYRAGLARAKSHRLQRFTRQIRRPMGSRRSTRQYSKPYAGTRYGISIVLGVISAVAFVLTLSLDDAGRRSGADAATVVSGVMGGFAVCLGAIALISSIQNSSVRIQRADRLYESYLGVNEAITFLELGLSMAQSVTAHNVDPRRLWNNPSLHLAVTLLGTKLKDAMDTGLYRLLAYVDDQNKVNQLSFKTSSATQAFTLLDQLVRISPEIVFGENRPQSNLITTPEQLMEIAINLRATLRGVSYSMVAQSLEFEPTLEALSSRGDMMRPGR